jgi:hypothetical protein
MLSTLSTLDFESIMPASFYPNEVVELLLNKLYPFYYASS